MSHSQHTTTAVLIVGAGPVGLLLGIQLQLCKDFPVHLIQPDRHSRIPPIVGTTFRYGAVSEQSFLSARVAGPKQGKYPILGDENHGIPLPSPDPAR